MNKTKYLLAVIYLPITFILVTSISFAATHQLMITPIQSVFTDQKRVSNIKISNPTDHPLYYAISIINMQKNGVGKMVEVHDQSKTTSLLIKSIRFSPRRALIKPGKKQLVKMMLRPQKELPPGEYKLWLHLVPQKTPQNIIDSNPKKPENRINVDLTVQANFPLIIQNGGIRSEVTPESVNIKESNINGDGLTADVLLNRVGDASAFGNIYIKHIPANSNETKQIGRASKVTVHLSENSKRVQVPLKKILLEELSDGKLEVTFKQSIPDARIKTPIKNATTTKQFTLPLP